MVLSKTIKKGEVHYEVIFSLIIGLIIIAIVASWLFQDYFTKEEIDWQICREALILRNILPEKDIGGVAVVSSKDSLPLECKTQVITIDYENVSRAEKEIGETIASCWYMVGKGEYRVFPGRSGIAKAETPCMMCARIRLDSDVRDFYVENYDNKDNRINLKRAVESPLEGYGSTVWDYLNPENRANAFNYFGGWNDTGFSIKFQRDSLFTRGFNLKDTSVFFLPRYFEIEKGDLFIGYSEPVKQLSWSGDRSVEPYMFFLQYSDFDKLSWNWALIQDIWQDILAGLTMYQVFTYECESCLKVCSSIESIPA